MVTPEQAPDQAEYVTLDFEKGKVVAVNHQPLSPAEVIETLNQIGGQNAIGCLDWIEDRVIGMKSRGIYETPGVTLLVEAHQRLESLTLTKETLKIKQAISLQWAELVYNGQWYSMANQAIRAFIEATQENVTGQVKLKLYKGNIQPAGMTSPYALFDEAVSGFGEDDLFDHQDAEGFINVMTLPTKIQREKGLI